VVGVQSTLFWVFAKSIAIQRKLLLPDSMFKRIRPLFMLERCALTGGPLVLAGLGAAFYALLYWYSRSFGRIDNDALTKVVCAASDTEIPKEIRINVQ
jgi:hypothetical protein